MNEIEIRRALHIAADAQRNGRNDQAAHLYRDVLARAGEQPTALNALGMNALAAGVYGEAADLFRRAIAVDPKAVNLWMNLATAHRRQDDTAGEKAALDGALACDQRHFMATVRLAELFERTGEPARATERWSGVLAMAPLIDERSPALETLFAHARDYVTRQQADFAEAVDTGLAAMRAEQSPADRRRVDAGIDHLLGRRQIYPNICAGLHIPFLPADEFFERGHFPWFGKIEQATGGIRSELEALLNTQTSGFQPYVAMAPGTPANKWSPLDHRPDWSAFHLWRNGQRNDDACARCPQTAALVEALPLARVPGRAPTVFFSLLQPGTHLPAHTGVSNMRTIVHLPLIVPDGCAFRVGGETRIWRTGEAWAFDDTIEHEAWNRSDKPRAILIFDVWNPYLTTGEQQLLREFFPIADRNGQDLRMDRSD
ncbi:MULTISPECIES: aspartyl/asparaginyl beta-hydroxylase domain-containing protein [unclassified Novosphingobium]|uniref:aspartyl/asparaginyl beta-hydroxylase domain-containing protein n=1 Tax=unclassified Novosphingobium TaxID=2644732 RepID=UPI00190F5F9D|nr:MULTISPECIES: aspartyl/asparaginyl beta-hydroxylase domain-containing protein [unclassified Novosphingobium]